MNKKNLLLLASFVALLLGGCKELPSSSSIDKGSSLPSETSIATSEEGSVSSEQENESTEEETETSTPDAESSEEPSIDEDGLFVTNSWPNAALQAYAANFDIKDTLPSVTLEREIHHGIVDWGFLFYNLIVITDDVDDLLDIAIPFEDAGYDVLLNDEDFYIVSPHEEIQLFAYYFDADDDGPAQIDIMLFIDEVADDYLFDYLDEHEGWPTDALNSYLALLDSTSVIPSLSDVSVSYTLLIEDDEYFPDPYFFIFIPGEERTLEYKALLENDGFDLELYDPDDFYPYYTAYKDAENLELEFGYYESGDGLPAGMHIYVTAYATIEPPVNPEQAHALDFGSADSMTVATDDLGVWETESFTMAIAKGDSTVYVGGDKSKGGYWHSPLRVYAEQEVTFSLKDNKAIDQLVITTDSGKPVDGLAYGFFIEDVRVQVSGAVVTIKPVEPINELTVIITEQVRFASLEVYYVDAPIIA